MLLIYPIKFQEFLWYKKKVERRFEVIGNIGLVKKLVKKLYKS